MRILAGLLLSAVLGLSAAEFPQQQIVYARVSPNPGGLNLFIAAADGAGERALLAETDLDYNPSFAPDANSVVFTSDRDGSADLFRVKPDGSAARTADRRSRLRRSGGVLARRQAARVRDARATAGRAICGRWICDAGARRR